MKYKSRASWWNEKRACPPHTHTHTRTRSRESLSSVITVLVMPFSRLRLFLHSLSLLLTTFLSRSIFALNVCGECVVCVCFVIEMLVIIAISWEVICDRNKFSKQYETHFLCDTHTFISSSQTSKSVGRNKEQNKTQQQQWFAWSICEPLGEKNEI